MLWELLLLLVTIWMVQRRWLMRRQVALAKQLKTNIKTYPILGHAYKFFGTNEDRMKSVEAFGRDAIEAGGISKILHFDQLFICVADPAVAEVLLSECLEKHDLLSILHLVIGHASILAPVSIWRHRRKIDALTFNTKNLIRFVKIFSEQGIAMADHLEKEVGKGTFSILEYTVVGSMNTVCETTMGINLNFQGSKFLNAIEELWQIAAYIVMCQPWFCNKFSIRFKPSYNTILEHKRTVYDFITKIIREKQKSTDGNFNHVDGKLEKRKTSFLDLQLETSDSSRKFSERELLEETLMLVVAGYDTTATNTAFTLVLLSRHPGVQDKVYQELKEVFGDSDRAVTYEDLPRLKYLTAVIKETLRLYPSTPVIARRADKDVELPSGITIVKDCGIFMNIWAVHRNPAYWGADADQFRPERFLDYTPKHPAAFMPFSYGPRGCVGYRYVMLLMKTTLSTLLRRYRVLAPPGVPQGAPLRTKYEIMMRHVDNFEIRLERRNK